MELVNKEATVHLDGFTSTVHGKLIATDSGGILLYVGDKLLFFPWIRVDRVDGAHDESLLH